jgi:hypothetical protein
MNRLRAVCAVCLLSVAVSAQSPPVILESLQSITRDELRDTVSFLASDELRGRDTGSEGYAAAALYAVTQFKKDGLEPIVTDDEGVKTFYQSVPMLAYDVGPSSVLSVRTPSGETAFHHRDRMVVFQTGSPSETLFADAQPVFLGYGIDDPGAGWSDYDGMDVRGRVVIVVGGAPSRQGKPVFAPDQDAYYRDFGRSGNARYMWAAGPGASGIIFVPDPVMASRWPAVVDSLARRQTSLRLPAGAAPAAPACLFLHPDAAADLLRQAGYAWEAGTADYRPAVLEPVRLTCRIRQERVEDIRCRNVVALLPGRDPALRGEYVVAHAHLDHLGVDSRGRVRNGADDNAAGVAAVLEAAEALARQPAGRSVLFVLFTGEEKGLLGSEWFMTNPPVAREQIVASLAADMIGRTSTGTPDVHFLIAAGPSADRLLAAGRRAADLLAAPVDLSLNQRDPDGHLRRCDLAPFLAHGVTAALVTRGFLPPVYHSVDDDAATLDWGKVERGARLFYAMLAEAGSGPAKEPGPVSVREHTSGAGGRGYTPRGR